MKLKRVLCALVSLATMTAISQAAPSAWTATPPAVQQAWTGPGMSATPASTAVTFDVLWWDSTPEYGGQAPDALRQAMSDHLDALPEFNSTYVASEIAGTLALELAANDYDVIVFDATQNGASSFDAADQAALTAFYAAHSNLLLDGTLYIRSINFNATTIFPGANGSTGDFTVNEVWQLGSRGGGVMIGTDHNCCQADPNKLLDAMVPDAEFSGITFPSLDGQFNGTDLLDALVMASPFDVFEHWDSVPTEGIAPTGVFLDIFGAPVELFSQVDVADDPGGGEQFSYISTSWDPSGIGPAFDCNNNGILDSIDIQAGTSEDVNSNGVPDECDPPEFTNSPCGQMIGLTVGVAYSHTVTASDPDPADMVTLSVAGTPAGATHTPDLPMAGNPVSTTFDWIPTNADIGPHVLTYTAIDLEGQAVDCVVTLVVAECHMIVASGEGSDSIWLGGHSWPTQLSGIQLTYPVTMTDIPSFLLPDPIPALKKRRHVPTLVNELFVQVLMWNPEVFPDNPEQWTQGLHVQMMSDGKIRYESFGTPDGMEIFAQVYTAADGKNYVRFPFTIEGL